MKDKKIANYRITDELLGHGSFSNVYLAFTQNDQKVAVKVINRSKIKECQINYFQNEITLLKNCKNQYIIDFIDVKKTKSNFYIFLQYCEGGNLAEFIAKQKKLPQAQAMRLFSQLVRGMHSMKKLNVIHRDLKPANIMMKNNNIKIVDFGLAKKFYKGEMLKTYVGSPLNMAPQILKGCEYNQKVDVYSAGTILYELLFGISPFNSHDIPSLIKQIDNQRINKSDCFVSADVKIILKKMLEPNPQKRIDFNQLLNFMHKYEAQITEEKITFYKKLSASAIPYFGILGGLSSAFNFDFCQIKQKSYHDLDIRLCAKLSQKLIQNKNRFRELISCV